MFCLVWLLPSPSRGRTAKEAGGLVGGRDNQIGGRGRLSEWAVGGDGRAGDGGGGRVEGRGSGGNREAWRRGSDATIFKTNTVDKTAMMYVLSLLSSV